MNEEVLKMAMKSIELERAPIGAWFQGDWACGPGTGEMIVKDIADETYNCAVVDTSLDCGTACCLAGTIAVQAGWTMVSPYPTMYRDPGRVSASHAINRETGEMRFIEDLATELLGVDERTAWKLFITSANITDVDAFKEHVTAVTGVTFD